MSNVSAQPAAHLPPQPPKPATGTLSWALGFLVFLPIPFLGAIAAAIGMAAPYGSAKKHGGLARENARSAANWGITYGIVSTVLLIVHFVVVFSVSMASSTGGAQGFYPVGTVITIYFALGILHVVLTIIGTVRSTKGALMRVPFAIPFIRA